MQDSQANADASQQRVAVVFQRPLPYLYLARRVFEQAGVPLEASAALPLAAEPYAAAVDLVCTFVSSGYCQSSLIGLLRSPHFAFKYKGQRLDDTVIEALDRTLEAAGYPGGRAALVGMIREWTVGHQRCLTPETGSAAACLPAAEVSIQLMDELRALEVEASGSLLVDVLLSFLRRHTAMDVPSDPIAERACRARLSILIEIDKLGCAYRMFDSISTHFAEVASTIRRWVESQTLVPQVGDSSVQLVDARAAAYGRFDELFLVGLVDGEWPERSDRSIFYPPSLLVPLGWPRERDRLRSERAVFHDLVELPLERIWLSTFSLENDSVVTPSNYLEDVADIGLATIQQRVDGNICVTPDEALARASIVPADISEPAAGWLALRLQADRSKPRFHGLVGPRSSGVYTVRALEQYLECPFKYFASKLLNLVEERDNERTLSPQQRGLFLHRVFERFFAQWEKDMAITVANLDHALERFRTIATEELSRLPNVDRPVLRAWLLGSAAAPGLAEKLFLLEVERPEAVVERLVEFRIDGEFLFTSEGHSKTVRIRGVADRIDLYADGTFRVIEYKSNLAPRREQALQLPLYAQCAQQQLDGHRGRTWLAAEAAYVAFSDPRLLLPLAPRNFDQTMADGERRVLAVLGQIEAGVYPPRPASLHLCRSCPYPTVCREDYVEEE